MEKIAAWALLAIISIIEVILLYMGYNGQLQGILLPLVTFLFGIITKTAVDKTISLKKSKK